MNAKETLELIAQPWCSIDDIMKLACIGRCNATALRNEIKKDLISQGYTLPGSKVPMIEVVKKLRIDIKYLERMSKELEDNKKDKVLTR